MSWSIAVKNGTAEDGFPPLDVEAVIETHRVVVKPGATATITGTSTGRLTLNANPVGRMGVAPANTDVNVLGDFSNFKCKVIQNGTALKLQVAIGE